MFAYPFKVLSEKAISLHLNVDLLLNKVDALFSTQLLLLFGGQWHQRPAMVRLQIDAALLLKEQATKTSDKSKRKKLIK